MFSADSVAMKSINSESKLNVETLPYCDVKGDALYEGFAPNGKVELDPATDTNGIVPIFEAKFP